MKKPTLIKATLISKDFTDENLQQYNDDLHLKAVSNALSRNPISRATFVQESLCDSKFIFSIDLDTLPITDQQKSGRCWLFAGLNVLREVVAKKCNLDKFELSQNYMAFWDKYEKINYFLESIIDRIDKSVEDRTLCWILETGIQDGGQWDMFVSLVQKYGVIPKNAMPESYQSSNTSEMNYLINKKLRKTAAVMQKMFTNNDSIDDIRAFKKEVLSELFAFLCANFGAPPCDFDFEYYDKDGKYFIERSMTPAKFFDEYIGLDLDNYVSIINAPTADKPYNKTFTVDYIGNVIGGKDIKYLNIPMQDMSALVISQLQSDEVVWFGCDVAPDRDRVNASWMDNAFDYETAFKMDFSMSKEDMMDYRHSAMGHAMVITGVNLDENQKPNRWKIQNSWGENPGDKGYYLMNNGFFETYVYQAVINKNFLSDEMKELLDAEPIHLNPWDPMGTLAW